MTVFGIDISAHNARLKLQAAKNEGVSFAILRAGYTGYGIGWTRQILRIWSGRSFPYQVGNGSGTTGFYRAEALQKK